MTRWRRPCCRRYPSSPSPPPQFDTKPRWRGAAMDKLTIFSPALSNFKAKLASILHVFLSLFVSSSAKQVDNGLPLTRVMLTFLKLCFVSELVREWQNVLLPAEENRRMCKEVGLSVPDEETGKGCDRDCHSPLSSARSKPLLLCRVRN